MEELRILVLFEHEGGFFTQIMLDAKQYKILSDLVSHPTNDFVPDDRPTPDAEMRYLPFRPNWSISAHHFDGLPSVYPDYPRAPPIED
jgi:hypothetical protein